MSYEFIPPLKKGDWGGFILKTSSNPSFSKRGTEWLLLDSKVRVIVKFEARFAKDLRAINNPKHFDKIKDIINTCKAGQDLSELKHVKKL